MKHDLFLIHHLNFVSEFFDGTYESRYGSDQSTTLQYTTKDGPTIIVPWSNVAGLIPSANREDS